MINVVMKLKNIFEIEYNKVKRSVELIIDTSVESIEGEGGRKWHGLSSQMIEKNPNYSPR